MTAEQVARFGSVVAGGGVALFPSDTVYGLATAPDSQAGARRLYGLKDRPPDRPSAVMFFALEAALAALTELGPRTAAALRALLPGPVTVVLANPALRYPPACGPRPDRLGLRVPRLAGALEPLAALERPVLQSSANRTGGPDARRLGDVDELVRAGVDLELDGGELPGTPSTVLDLAGYEQDGSFEILREGAMPAERLAGML
ncbi:MAG: L-threonylcarbamoyladenylate synthase [Thermoleophilaceae bacterium]